jgi:hypothetical protein
MVEGKMLLKIKDMLNMTLKKCRLSQIVEMEIMFVVLYLLVKKLNMPQCLKARLQITMQLFLIYDKSIINFKIKTKTNNHSHLQTLTTTHNSHLHPSTNP